MSDLDIFDCSTTDQKHSVLYLPIPLFEGKTKSFLHPEIRVTTCICMEQTGLELAGIIRTMTALGEARMELARI